MISDYLRNFFVAIEDNLECSKNLTNLLKIGCNPVV